MLPEFDTMIHGLTQSIQEGLPGWKAQKRMLPMLLKGERELPSVHPDTRKAGVLILFYPAGNQPHLVLTKRSSRLKTHQGQISLPGGAQENGELISETALREAEEELNVPSSDVKTIGQLTPLYVEPSLFCIFPLVGFLNHRPDFQPNPAEVSQMIEVALPDLLDPAQNCVEDRTIRGWQMSVPYFSLGGHKVWGATAMILSELIVLLKEQNR